MVYASGTVSKDSAAGPHDVFSAECPSRQWLTDVTGRWGALTLAALVEGPLRFGALRRRIDGISDKMLSQNLQTLEGDGLVIRKVLSVTPPSVEYALSEKGAAVADSVVKLIDTLYLNMGMNDPGGVDHDAH